MLAVLLGPALALRVVTQLAYRPALLYIDSPKYLVAGMERFDPEGYRDLMLVPLLHAGNLALVAAVQHALGLAMGVTIYALVARRGSPRWAAALAAAPILLDAYQLQMEQTIMPDVMFEALILAGLALLLWKPRPALATLTLAGFILGASATVRQVGEALIVPAVAFAVLASRGWGRRLTVAGLVAVSFVIPVLVYMAYSAAVLGDGFQLSDQGDAVLYGRVAAAADCAALRLPAVEHPLCPSRRTVAALGVDGLVNDPSSPIYSYTPPPPVDRAGNVEHFSVSVIERQPFRVAGAITRDSVKLFALTRDTSPGDTPVWRWQFRTTYQVFPPDVSISSATALIRATGGGGAPTAVRPLAEFLRAYQLHGGYTPGPFFLVVLAAGLGGAVAGRRRAPVTALACLTATATGAAVLLGADMYEFSWRYQLPALVTLPIAGALGLAVLSRRRTSRAIGFHSGTAPVPPPKAGRSR
jgi:hypothetical protein